MVRRILTKKEKLQAREEFKRSVRLATPPPPPPPDKTEQRTALRAFFLDFLSKYQVRTDSGEIIVLGEHLRDVQDLLLDIIVNEFVTTNGCRLILLKPRQAGWSTLIQAVAVCLMVHRREILAILGLDEKHAVAETVAVTVAHRRDAACHLLGDMGLYALKHFPHEYDEAIGTEWDKWGKERDPTKWRKGGLQTNYKGIAKQDNVFYILKNGATMRSVSARNAAFGHGETIGCVHFSEASRWFESVRNRAAAENILTAMLPGCPTPELMPLAFAVIESTACGQIGTFHDLYWQAKAGKVNWKAVFIPWYLVEKYSLPATEKEEYFFQRMRDAIRLHPSTVPEVATQKGFTDDEVEIIRMADDRLTMGNLVWRRKIGLSNCGTLREEQVQKFRESYPTTDKEAFISSGSPAFSSGYIQERMEKRRPVLWQGSVELGPDRRAVFRKDHGSEYRTFLPYKADHEYLMAADVAGGRTAFNADDRQDSSVVHVLDRSTEEQVAVYHSVEPTPQELAGIIYAIGSAWGFPPVVVDRSGVGAGTVEELRVNLRYPKLYLQTRWNGLLQQREARAGMNIGEKVRKAMMYGLRDATKHSRGKINDLATLEEMNQMILARKKNGEGFSTGTENQHDDLAVAWALLWLVHNETRMHTTEDLEEGRIEPMHAADDKPIVMVGEGWALRRGGREPEQSQRW